MQLLPTRRRQGPVANQWNGHGYLMKVVSLVAAWQSIGR